MNCTKPKTNFMKKSQKTAKSRNFDLNAIGSIGYHVLSLLKFLHDRNMGHGNLHAGNVFLIGDGYPLVSEVESYIFGVSSFLRNYIIQLRAPSSSLEALDIYSFGHLMFEMATGYPLQNATCDNALPNTMIEPLSK